MSSPFDISDIIANAGNQPSLPDPAGGIAPTGQLGAFINAIRGVESGGNPNAISPQGASGSMQIMPGTFRQYAAPGEVYTNDAHRTAAAIRKIEDDFKFYNGDLRKVAAAYIGGRGAIAPDGTIRGDRADAHGTTPVKYANMVLGRMGDGGGEYTGPAAPDHSSLIDSIVGAAEQSMGSVRPAQPKQKGTGLRRIADAGIDLAKGAVGVGEVVTGLGRLIPGVSQGLDAIGYDPQELKNIMSEGYSDARQAKEQELAQNSARRIEEGAGLMERAGGAAMDILRNPSIAAGRVLESAPTMLMGGLGAVGKARSIYAATVEAGLARGLSAEAAALAGKEAVVAAGGSIKTLGAIGEGLTGMGSAAEQIAHDGGNVYAAIPAGVISAGIGRAAAAIPGFGDAKTAAMLGSGALGATGGAVKRVGKGILSEGTQEGVQSGQEQMWQNVGTGKPLGEGVAEAVGSGVALGGIMGGGFGLAHSENSTLRGMPNQTGEQLAGARADEQAIAQSNRNLYPMRADETGQYNLLLPKQAAPANNPADVAAGPTMPEGGVSPALVEAFGPEKAKLLTQMDPDESAAIAFGPGQFDGMTVAQVIASAGQPAQPGQGSLDLPEVDPYQMDMFGGPEQAPVQPDRRAPEAPAEAAQPGQMSLPLGNPRRPITPDVSQPLAAAAEAGALERVAQGAPTVSTPQQIAEQDNTARTLFDTSRATEEAPAARPIEVPGQAAPNPDAKLELPANPSLYDLQMEARRKVARGELLDDLDAALLRRPLAEAPAQPIETAPASKAKPVDGQGELFGKVLDQPAVRREADEASATPDTATRPMFDENGTPTYDAAREGTPEEIAAQFGKEFTLKVTPQRAPILSQVGRLYYDEKIDFDEATHVAEQVRAGKNKAAAKAVAALEDRVLNAAPAPSQPATANAVSPAQSNPVESAAAPAPAPEAPAAPVAGKAKKGRAKRATVEPLPPTTPVAEVPAEPKSVVGTPLADTIAKNEEVTKAGPNIRKVSSAELASAAEDGDHPYITADDAELELARRLQDADGDVNDADYARADKYFNENFPKKDARWEYLRELDKRNRERDGKPEPKAAKAKYRNTKEGTGSDYVSPAEAQAVVDAVTGTWQGAPEIEVVENIGGLPADIRSQAEADGANPKGVFYRGKVWIVSDNNSSVGDVLATILHEVAGHAGLRALLGKDFAKTMTQIYNTNPEIRKAADAKIAEGLDKNTAVEEVLAEKAEKGVKPNVLDKVANAIRNWMRRVGLGRFAEGFTNGEVKELLEAAKERIVNGDVAAAEMEDKALYRTASLADLPEPPAGTFMTRMQDRFGDLGTKSAVLGLMTRRQLVDRFGHIPAMKTLSTVIEKMSAKAKKLQSEVAVLDKAFERLSPEETLLLSKVMLEATMNQYHVDKELEQNTHLDEIAHEFQFNKLKAEYDAMPQKLKDLYQQVKAKFESDWAETNALISRRIVDQYRADLEGKVPDVDAVAKIKKTEDRIALKKTLRTVADRKLVSRLWDDMDSHAWEMSQMTGPYFPLMRFGNQVVVAKSEALSSAQEELTLARQHLTDLYQQDEGTYTKEELAAARKAVSEAQGAVNRMKGSDDHYLVEFYESKAEAEARAKQIQELFKDDPTMKVERKMREAHFASLDSAPYSFMQKLESEIAANMPEKDAAAIKQAVRDMYIKQMPEKAAMKQQLRRLNVRGAKRGEMRRAIVSAGLRASFNISRMEYSVPMNDALGELRRGSTDTEKLLGEEMSKRMLDTMQQANQSKLINAMSNLSYLTMLGLSPSFLVLNMTQPWTVSLPLMAARHGFGTSGAAMTRATAEVVTAMKNSWRKAGGGATLNFDLDLSQFKDAAERAMLQDLLERGIIDVTQEHDLSSQSSGDAAGWTDKAANWSAMPAHQTEIVNRVATALAAYRLERAVDLKAGTDNATSYAEKIIADTHLDYTAENAPRLMQGKMAGGLGKLIFQFKKYQQGMIFLNFKLLRDAIKERKITGESGKALMYLWAGQMAIAGASGLPMAGILAGLASIAGMFAPDDEDKEYRQRFYEGLKDAVGETMARLIMKGAPAAFLDTDVSNRAGMGDLLNPFKFAREGKTGQETVANSLLALAGPAASMTANWFEAANKAHKGDMIGSVRSVLPRALQGPLDAYQMSENGLTTQRGAQYMKPDDLSAWDVAAKALTFNSTDMTDLRERRFALDNATHARDEARHNLLNQYAKASLKGEDMGDLMEKIAAFNERNPEKGVRITQGTLLKSRQAQRKYQRDVQNGVRVQKQNARLAKDMGVVE